MHPYQAQIVKLLVQLGTLVEEDAATEKLLELTDFLTNPVDLDPYPWIIRPSEHMGSEGITDSKTTEGQGSAPDPFAETKTDDPRIEPAPLDTTAVEAFEAKDCLDWIEATRSELMFYRRGSGGSGGTKAGWAVGLIDGPVIGGFPTPIAAINAARDAQKPKAEPSAPPAPEEPISDP